MSEAPESTQRVALVNLDRVVTLLEVVGFVCLGVAAFAFDWRLGVALVGVVLLAVAWVLDRTARTPVAEELSP